MELKIIVAVADNGAIGRSGDLLFHLSADLRRFKELTMVCPIIMGRKTFESFPKGPLPGRRNIVITRNADYSHPGIETAPSLEAAIAMVTETPVAYVIGGGEIYAAALPMADTIELTRIHAEVPDADTFFPPIDPTLWHETASSQPTPQTTPPITFLTLSRTK